MQRCRTVEVCAKNGGDRLPSGMSVARESRGGRKNLAGWASEMPGIVGGCPEQGTGQHWHGGPRRP